LNEKSGAYVKESLSDLPGEVLGYALDLGSIPGKDRQPEKPKCDADVGGSISMVN
jgi:hypothetical protein